MLRRQGSVPRESLLKRIARAWKRLSSRPQGIPSKSGSSGTIKEVARYPHPEFLYRSPYLPMRLLIMHGVLVHDVGRARDAI